MKILYFASASLAAGCREETWSAGRPLSVREFWEETIRRHPSLEPQRAICRLARNQEYADEDAILNETDEVAILPPVSGG